MYENDEQLCDLEESTKRYASEACVDITVILILKRLRNNDSRMSQTSQTEDSRSNSDINGSIVMVNGRTAPSFAINTCQTEIQSCDSASPVDIHSVEISVLRIVASSRDNIAHSNCDSQHD